MNLAGTMISDSSATSAVRRFFVLAMFAFLAISVSTAFAGTPTVVNVTAKNTTGGYNANGTFTTGQVVQIIVTFSEAVTLSSGHSSRLALNTLPARYAVTNTTAMTGITEVTFNYTVQSGDSEASLDYNATNTLETLTGTITSTGTADAAVLTLPSPSAANSLGFMTNIIIDALAPVLTSVSISANGSNHTTAAQGTVITINFTANET